MSLPRIYAVVLNWTDFVKRRIKEDVYPEVLAQFTAEVDEFVNAHASIVATFDAASAETFPGIFVDGMRTFSESWYLLAQRSCCLSHATLKYHYSPARLRHLLCPHLPGCRRPRGLHQTAHEPQYAPPARLPLKAKLGAAERHAIIAHFNLMTNLSAELAEACSLTSVQQTSTPATVATMSFYFERLNELNLNIASAINKYVLRHFACVSHMG